MLGPGVTGLALLALTAGIDLLVVASLVRIGRAVGRGPGEETARRAFTLWWLAMALAVAGAVAQLLLASAGFVDVPVHVMFVNLQLLTFSVALAGLLYHVTFIYVGDRRIVVPIGLFALAVYLTGVHALTAAEPYAVRATASGIDIDFAAPMPWTATAFLAAMVLAQAGAFAGYVGVALRVDDREARRRARTVAIALGSWIAMTVVGAWTPLGRTEAWPVVSVVAGIVIAGLLVAAYAPPRWLQAPGDAYEAGE